MPIVLDGKKVAESVYSKLLLEASLLPNVPKIVFITVGDDAATQTYVRMKTKKAQDLGLQSEVVRLAGNITEEELFAKIQGFNRDKNVQGILLQLPLPGHLNKGKILREIDPCKDVDGLHPENIGRLLQGEARFVPCTPAGIVEILKFHQIPLDGAKAVIVGRSEIVGKPLAQLLLNHNATVTICHSKTRNLAEETRRADILVAACGKPKFIGADHVRDGAVVIDVGINRVNDAIVGDVDYEAVQGKVTAITPVPGGVGPMTIAMLMKNLIFAATLQFKPKALAS